MKILILNWRDMKHPLAGGAEESLYRHAQYWKKKGASIEWFASGFKNSAKQEEIDGITYIRQGSHYTVHYYAFKHYLKMSPDSFDVIVDCFHFIPYFSPFYHLHAKKIALINEAAKNAWFSNIRMPFSAIGYVLEPLFFRPYKNIKFITSAQSIFDELVNSYPIPKEHIHIIPHGVTIEKTNFKKEKKPTILYASRITFDKGIEDAVVALSQVIKKNPNIQFWIIGKPEVEEYLSKVKKMIKSLGIEKQTKLWGFVSQKKKFELMQKSWCLIHPSIREGWGLNVIESNSVGTPAIGYDVTGLRDSIKDNKTGILVEEKSPEAMAKQILRLTSNAKLRLRLSRSGQEYAKQFTWEEAGEKSWGLIQNTLKKPDKRLSKNKK